MMGVREIVTLLVVVAIAVALSLAGQHYLDLQRAAAQNETRGGLLRTASDGIAQGEVIDSKQEEVSTGLAQGREQFTITIAEAKRNEPETAARADRAVPDSVRNAYRQRRLARERLGCAGEQCEERR